MSSVRTTIASLRAKPRSKLARRMTCSRAEILRRILRDPGVTCREIAVDTGKSRNRVWQELQLLVRDGFLDVVRINSRESRYRPCRRAGACPTCGAPAPNAKSNEGDRDA